MSLLLAIAGAAVPPVETVAEVERLGGGGDYRFLDPEYHKRRISPKVRRIIKKIAKKAIEEVVTDSAQNAQKHRTAGDYAMGLYEALRREEIAWNRFYADLLRKQIEEQTTNRIRMQLELLGIYEQIRIDEEDEQALMLLMMEL